MERILEVIISIEATQYEYLKFFSADTNKVKFKFIGIDTSNCNATLSVTDSKNNTKEYIVDSSFVFNVPTSLLADRYSCNLKLYNTINQRVTAYPFYLYIDQEPTPKTPIESDANYPVLGSLINEVRELESTVNFNENTRNTNEAERILNENTRKANEIKRETAYKEITDLRKGVDGNVYKSANDRVKHEVDQLQTQISNASNLPFSGEYISAEHSIKGVCKDMVIKGKTLFNLLPVSKATITSKALVLPVELMKPNTEYTITYYISNAINNPSGCWLRINYADGTMQNINNANEYVNGVYKFNFRTENKPMLEGLVCWIRNFTGGLSFDVEVILLEGKFDNASPYFEGIKSVSDITNKISILSCGKNLCKQDDILINKNLSPDGVTITDLDGRAISGFCKVKKNTQYKPSGGVGEFYYLRYDKDKNPISQRVQSTTTINTENATYIKFFFNKVYSDNRKILDINEVKYQLEEGIQATTYEPYKEDKRDISLPNGLREWDSIDFNNAELVEGTGITRMTSNDEISYISELTNTILFRKAFSLAKDGYSSICNKFKYNLMYTKDEEGHYLSSSSIYIRINKTKLVGYSDTLSNLEKINLFKLWLQTNLSIFYFQLAIPTKTKIQGLDDLTTYNDITYAFTIETGELRPTIECKIPCNTPAVIQSLSARNTVLQEENKALNNALEDNKLNSLSTNVDQEYRLLKLEMGV